MHVWTNRKLCDEHAGLKALEQAKTQTQLSEILTQEGVVLMVLYGDFYSSQDAIPFGISDRL